MEPSKNQHVVICSMEQAEADVNGGCLNCGHIQLGGVEPDAQFYKCSECGQYQVFGLAELAIMGRLEVVDDPNCYDDDVQDYIDHSSEFDDYPWLDSGREDFHSDG